MPSIPPTYIVDSSGQTWMIAVDNNAILSAVPVGSQPSSVSRVYLNAASADNTSYALTVIGNPPPSGYTWGEIRTTVVNPGSYPTQQLVTAPNGTVYGVQIATVGPPILGAATAGITQVALPSNLAPLNCTTPISTLATNVLERLEDPTSIFWNEQFEIYTGLVEAMNDLMMLVGRPTQTVGMQFNLTPNSVWQYLPKGLFLISDVWGPQSRLRKGTLFDLDYTMPSWGPDWENDTDPAGPTMWAPIGMNIFAVHPAPSVPQTVLLDGIAYPVAETAFPYNGNEIVPFHHEFFEYLEMYTAHYARIKEMTSEFQESIMLYQNYLQGAKRLTTIEDRRDPLIFSPSFGARAGLQSHVQR